jgi:DsbC/DsbD-like thiol-disulfide interchange protein
MLLLVLAAAAAPFPAAAAAPPPARYIAVDFVASTMRPRPGSTIILGFRMTPQPGWHGYWSNPGESGIAPDVKWTAPPGVRFGPLLHPAPTLLQSMGLSSYVHAGEHVLVSRVTVGRAIRPGTPLPVSAALSFAACSDKLCVPERASLSLQMVAGDGTPSPDGPLLQRAIAQLPAISPQGTFTAGNGEIVLQLPESARLKPATVRFYPDSNGFFDPVRARSAGGTQIRIASPLKGTPPTQITGVVSDGSAAYRIAFHRAQAASPLPTAEPAHAKTPDSAPELPGPDAGARLEARPHAASPPRTTGVTPLAIIGLAVAALALAVAAARLFSR